MPENDKDPQELMKQRDDLLAKLKKLEAKKESTKEKIYQKVRKDYEIKLEELNSLLKEQEGVVKERISVLKKEVNSLQEERESYADKAEELKLRFELGEFEEDEYEKVLAKEEARIRELDKKLGTVAEELDSMKGFVGGDSGAETEPGVSEPTFEELEESAPPEPQTEQAKGQEADFVQEKEFEAAFSDDDAGTEEEQTAEIAESLEESIDDLLSETSGDQTAGETHTEKPTEETDAAAIAEEPQDEPEETTSDESEEPQIEGAFDTGIISEGDAIKEETSKLEGFPEDSPGEEDRGGAADDEEGLQCPKCNFVNSKDSWYCEKCGAELLQ